jgi:hypothetical protein
MKRANRYLRILFVLAVVVGASAASMARAQAGGYTFQQLDTSGLKFNQGYDIAEGIVVGYGIGPAQTDTEHAYAWRLDNVGQRQDISGGVLRTMATSVDDAHQITGIAFTADAIRESKVAFWSSPSAAPVLTAPDLSWSEGFAISGEHYVGWGHRLQGPNPVPDRGFVWNNNGSSQRVALESPRSDGGTTTAESIDGNWVAGYAQITNTDRFGAAAWDIADLGSIRAVDLHPAGHDWSTTASVRGTTAVGLARQGPVGESFNHAWKWDLTSGQGQDLHALIPASMNLVASSATDLVGNTVVGSAMDADGKLKALAWDLSTGTVTDLTQFLPAGVTFSVTEAINRSGQIVGEYWLGSEDRNIFVLTPDRTDGDATIDGVVNLSDFNVLAANFGKTGRAWTEGDFSHDGVVNLTDFNLLAQNFGLSARGPTVTPDDWAALGAAVPEPTGAGVLLAASAALLARVRRRRA